MSTLNCDPKRLQDAIAGILDPQNQNHVEDHLENCQHCQKQLKLFAADDNDWGKVSDYFFGDQLSTSNYAGEQTIDIQLVRQGSDSRYVVTESETESPIDHSSWLEPASHPEMLGRIDGFEIEQMIGKGGMGIVFKGFDTDLNRPVAIKVLADHLASNGVARQRFAREARAAAAVIHPNVVPIHSVNSSAKRPYLVMTLVSGRSLQAHIAQHGPMAVKEIVRIGKQIAAGLSAAHREGLVHRDIKPANILLEKDVSRVMITDFGLARAANDAAITQTGWLAGTPHYMSPEQATGREVDARSDLFSLGSVLYFMATGIEPFRADIPVAVLQKISSQDPEAVRAVNSDATSTLANVIEKLMSKNPGHRFQSADDVENVLTQYLAHLEQPRKQPKPKIKLVRPKNWLRKLVVGMLGLAALAGIVALTVTLTLSSIRQPEPQPWPEGLITPDQWQAEINSLTNDVKMLESGRGISDQSMPFHNSIPSEEKSIEASIYQLEQILGKSP